MLKCPICGREYSYESKICRECESYLEYSGLASSIEVSGYKGDFTHKWNCAAFLNDYNSIFTIKGKPKVYVEITNEPFSLRITPARSYEWNTEPITRFRSIIEKSFAESKIAVVPELIDDIMEFIERKSDSLLIYE
ncbi:MAG: hypothetical protein ACFFB1_06750 [Promethearchaeota archaeon]